MISFTQGDTAVLNLTATDGNGNPIDLTSAVFTTYILGPGGVIASFPNGQHTIVSASAGTFTLSLGFADTDQCGVGNNKQILTKIVQGSSIVYLRGVNILNVNPPVPLQ